MPESDAKRPFKREFASRGYNSMVRLFLHSKLYDHQCGFKAFRRALLELLDEIENQHWFWTLNCLSGPSTGATGSLSSLFTGGMEDQARSISQRISLEWVRRSSAWWNCFFGLIFRKGKIFLTAFLAILILALLQPFWRIEVLDIKHVSPEHWLLHLLLRFLAPERMRFQQILNRLGNHYGIGFLTGSIFISQSANVILPR